MAVCFLWAIKKDSLLPVINMKYLEHLPHDTYRISHYNERLFFADIRNARRKTIDLIFKVLGPEVKNAFISVIEWPRILAWYLKMQEIVINSLKSFLVAFDCFCKHAISMQYLFCVCAHLLYLLFFL